MAELLLKDKTFQLIGICMEVHRTLGHGFSEIVYNDAIQYELDKHEIFYEREKQYVVPGKNVILTHCFFADFVAFDEIILEN